MLKSHINRLCKELQAEELFMQENENHWIFFVDREIAIALQKQGSSINITCDLGPAPTDGKSLEEMLYSNLAARGTQGAVLAIDSAGQKALLWRQIPEAADYEWFCNELEDFSANAEFWSEFVKGAGISAPSTTTTRGL